MDKTKTKTFQVDLRYIKTVRGLLFIMKFKRLHCDVV